MKTNDYLTLVTAEGRANKLVTVKDGVPVKKPGEPIVEATARTVHVPDQAAMYKLLTYLAEHENMVLCNGFFPGTEPAQGESKGEPFTIMSQAKLRKLTDADNVTGWHDIDGRQAIARLKENMQPSSWQQLDRDYAPGIPAHLENISDEDYPGLITKILPDFSMAGYIRVDSTSRRVLYNGEPISTIGCRYWFQIEDPSDETFGQRLKLQAAVNGLGFMKTNKVGVGTLWAIFDPTVYSRERLVYDGKPKIEGEGLELAPPAIVVHKGPAVDTRLISELSPAEDKKIEKDFKLTVRRAGSSGGVDATVDQRSLSMATEIETQQHGKMTLEEFFLSEHEKLRCQATLRDSNTWNAFLCRDPRGLPQLYDNGTHTMYQLPPDAATDIQVARIKAILERDHTELLEDDNLRALAHLSKHSPGAYARLRLQMTQIPGVRITALERAMKGFSGETSSSSMVRLARDTIRTVGTGNLIHWEGRFWYWDTNRPGAWRPLMEPTWLKQQIHETLEIVSPDEEWSATEVENIYKLMAPEVYQRIEIDRCSDTVNAANGELFLKEGRWQLRPHRKADFATACLPVAFDPTAKAPRFSRFLKEVFQGDEHARSKRRLILQMMGYSMLRDCRFEKLLLLVGEGGNGKSVLMFVLEQMLGQENVCAVQPAELDNKFQRAHLEGKFANVVTEIPKGAILPDGAVKAIASGETTTVEHKFGNPFDLAAYATQWWGTNNLPAVRDFSNATTRRALVLNFNNKFDVPGRRDERLKYSLAENELPGVLNLALWGLKSILTDGWVECPESDDNVARWFREANSVATFLDESTVPLPDGRESYRDVFDNYRLWCSDYCVPKVSKREFTHRLAQEGHETTRSTAGATVIIGLKLRRNIGPKLVPNP